MPVTRSSYKELKEEINKLPSDRKYWILEDFSIGSRIGHGKFGNVYVAKEKETQIVVALKSLDYQSIIKMNILHQVKREIQIQLHLKHKNIISLYAYFTTNAHIYIVLEYAKNGSLFQLLHRCKSLSTHRTAYIVDCVADALAYCHKFNVIHRDIKPENILLTENYDPKLADFGCSVQSNFSDRTTLCGTTDYLAPEMAMTAVNKNPVTHSHKIDCWAVGILLCELLTGKAPFTSVNASDIVKNIVKCEFSREYKEKLGHAYEAVIQVVKINPEDRMELNEWRDNEWLREQVKEYELKRLNKK